MYVLQQIMPFYMLAYFAKRSCMILGILLLNIINWIAVNNMHS